MPLDFLERVVGRIAATVALPLTVDFEGGYASDAEVCARNAERIVAAGAAGINFEDGIIGAKALHETQAQCRRIEAIRRMADRVRVPLFINARTDLFLHAGGADHAALLDAAAERASAYAGAGASGFFAPGLVDETLIETLCARSALPVNIMAMNAAPPARRLAELGVARISHGPRPYAGAVRMLTEQARAAFGELAPV